MIEKSAVLFRASNISFLDYPYEAAIESALCFFDEAVIVVDMNSEDDTPERISEIAYRNPGCVVIASMEFVWDRGWQERWWRKAITHTDAEWLAWLDLDEVIDPCHYDVIAEAMEDPTTHLVNFKFIHFYGTSRYVIQSALTHNTRLGRRSEGYGMVNRNSDEKPHDAACFATYHGGENAHEIQGEHIRRLDVPILHYGWCRHAASLTASQAKHKAWYADGGDLIDGRMPVVTHEYDFTMRRKFDEGHISRYGGPLHPSIIKEWFDSHWYDWQKLNDEILIDHFSEETKCTE